MSHLHTKASATGLSLTLWSANFRAMDKSINPFTDWTETQQCVRAEARNIKGCAVHFRDPTACTWSAEGWLLHLDYWMAEYWFHWFVWSEQGQHLKTLNDVLGWKPADFREAWDRFEANEISSDRERKRTRRY